MVNITTPVNTIEEVEKILLESTEKNTKMSYLGMKLFFTREEKDGKVYFIQRLENAFYGNVFYDGAWIKSYPHLNNIKDGTKMSIEASILEEKVNGTNIGIGMVWTKSGRVGVVRTRMTPFPVEFPVPTFWNSTINGMQNKDISKKLLALREEMLAKYPQFYIVAGDGEYVGLKVQEVVNSILDVKKIQKAYQSDTDYMFFFELVGKINPIIVDSEVEYGLYDFDMKMILLDVLDTVTNTFVNRERKEKMARELKLEIVPVRFTFNTIDDLRKSIPLIKSEATVQKIEGYVLKNGAEIIKVKPDVILESAYRLNSMLKGYIYLPDLLNYISKVVTADHLSKPEEYEGLIELIAEEAKADYAEDIVSKNMGQIRKHVAESMAVLVADKILKEHWDDIRGVTIFESKDAMFKFLNLEIPKRFSPLKSYIDYEVEKTTEDKELRDRMKRHRTNLFGKVAKYCMAHTHFTDFDETQRDVKRGR